MEIEVKFIKIEIHNVPVVMISRHPAPSINTYIIPPSVQESNMNYKISIDSPSHQLPAIFKMLRWIQSNVRCTSTRLWFNCLHHVIVAILLKGFAAQT